MKKLIIILGIALFCLANVYAQANEQHTNKNTEEKVTVIVDGDTIQCSKDLFYKYSLDAIIEAYQKDSLIVKIDDTIKLSKWCNKSQTKVIVTYLKRKGNEVIETTSLPMLGEWETEWFSIIVPILFFIAGLLLIFKIDKISHKYLRFFVRLFLFIIFVLSGLLIVVYVVYDLWFLVIISVVFIGLVLLSRYLYGRHKTKKLEVEAEI
jgi:hypothetical protein